MIRNKRGIIFFGWILAIIGMVTISAAYVTLSGKENKVSDGRPVGQNQFELYAAYQTGEEMRYAIDAAAKRAAERAAVILAPRGGFHGDYPCGETSDGYAIWVRSAQDCYPNVPLSFATLIDQDLANLYFKDGNLEIPKSGYNYYISGGDMKIVGKATNFTSQNLSDRDHFFLINGWPAEGTCLEELDYPGMDPTSYSSNCG